MAFRGVELIFGPATAGDGHQGDEGRGVAGVGDDAGLDPAVVNYGPEADIDGACDVHLRSHHEVIVLAGVTLQVHGVEAAGGVLRGVVAAAGLIVDAGVGAGVDGAVPAGVPGTVVGGILEVHEEGDIHGTAGGATAEGDNRRGVAHAADGLHTEGVGGVGTQAGEGVEGVGDRFANQRVSDIDGELGGAAARRPADGDIVLVDAVDKECRRRDAGRTGSGDGGKHVAGAVAGSGAGIDSGAAAVNDGDAGGTIGIGGCHVGDHHGVTGAYADLLKDSP